MLELKDVVKNYHGQRVVDGLSFSVDSGQVLGIIGSNGAGKSTCVSMIATLIKPDAGTILYNGEDISRHPDAIRGRMGFVPQEIALYESLTGLDNLKFWGKSYGVPSNRIDDEIERVSGIIGFDRDMLRKRVSECSGGMKRRLNIGVSLLSDPELVVLDEPTTGIDMQSADQILAAIEALRERGKSVIFVGHYMEEVERISTHFCIMEEGKSRAFGEKEELLGSSEPGLTLAQLYKLLCGGIQ